MTRDQKGMQKKQNSPNYELTDEDVLRMALHRFGIKNQTDLAIEEMSELITALSHWHRGRIRPEDVISEIADVCIMTQQLALYFGEDAVKDEVRRKVDRLKTYLDGDGYKR